MLNADDFGSLSTWVNKEGNKAMLHARRRHHWLHQAFWGEIFDLARSDRTEWNCGAPKKVLNEIDITE